MVSQQTQEAEVWFITPEELAMKLGISRPLVFRMLKSGKIPARRLSRRWIISRQGVQEWLAEGDNPDC